MSKAKRHYPPNADLIRCISRPYPQRRGRLAARAVQTDRLEAWMGPRGNGTLSLSKAIATASAANVISGDDRPYIETVRAQVQLALMTHLRR